MVFAHVALPSSNLRSVLSSVKLTPATAIQPTLKSDGVTSTDARSSRYSLVAPPSTQFPIDEKPPALPSTANTSSVDSQRSKRESNAGAPSTDPSSNSSGVLPWPKPNPANKMHQTSSRLLRMTDEDRPFTRVS